MEILILFLTNIFWFGIGFYLSKNGYSPPKVFNQLLNKQATIIDPTNPLDKLQI